MEGRLYKEMAELEETHWWFRGRRAVICDVLQRTCGKSRGTLLDVGLGTGRNAAAFIRMGFTVEGIEHSPEALAYARTKAPTVKVLESAFPAPALQSGQYDVVTLLDVVEHLKDDAGALREVRRVLKPGGLVLITVPAFRFLWSVHDERAHHYRRYRRRELERLLEEAGFRSIRVSYYNWFLFLPIALMRLVSTVTHRHSAESDFSRSPAILNPFFAWLFGSERFLLRVASLPFGVSLIATARAV